MNKLKVFLFALPIIWISCTRTETVNPEKDSGSIVLNDSSEFNGRLFVYTYDFFTNNRLAADVYLYTQYEDIQRDLFLYYKRTQSNTAEADFGYLLQGNYYVVSRSNNRSDTSLVQVLGKREVKRNVYLK
jgi:hypothetical protein